MTASINKKTILITGGAGFVGSNLVRYFYDLNYKILSIDNYSTGSTNNHIKGPFYIKEDIELFDFNTLKDIDYVIHCAAKARIKPSFIDDSKYFTTNINGTYNVIKYCSFNKIPIIYIGTSSHHNGKYANPYTFTKDIGEDIVRLYQQHFGLIASIARLYNVYGSNELTNENGTIIGKWKYNYQNNLPFIIYGDGSKRRDFTHINDIVDAMYQIINNNKYGYEFELGRGQNYSIIEVAEMFKYKQIIFEKNCIGEAIETLADNTSTKNILGWCPKHNLVDYINNIINT